VIEIKPSPTADTRTCDYKNVTEEELYKSSVQHINDVYLGMYFFVGLLLDAATNHDPDKLTNISGFHRDFVRGFPDGDTPWWDAHRKLNRHHLNQSDGVPEDVNLIDVLDYIADCVMAGMARSGEVYELTMEPQVLMRAFRNTIELLKKEVVVVK
jgi:hypothetical protein